VVAAGVVVGELGGLVGGAWEEAGQISERIQLSVVNFQRSLLQEPESGGKRPLATLALQDGVFVQGAETM
jgi:uncharacterized protein YdgA (DUF945 family)